MMVSDKTDESGFLGFEDIDRYRDLSLLMPDVTVDSNEMTIYRNFSRSFRKFESL
jgi:hypothetical protein